MNVSRITVIWSMMASTGLTLWRRGAPRSMPKLSSTMAFFIAASTGEFVLSFRGIKISLLTPSLFFLGVVGAMAYERCPLKPFQCMPVFR